MALDSIGHLYDPQDLLGRSFEKPRMPIQVVETPIIETDATALVNSANNWLRHGSGVARQIADAIPGHQRQCDRYIRQRGPLQIGKAVMVPSPELSDGEKRRFVVHAIGMGYAEMNERGTCRGKISATPESVYSAIWYALAFAQKENCPSVSFPLMCSRKGGLTKDESAFTMLMALADFEKAHAGFDQIWFHGFQEGDRQALLRLLESV